MVNMFSGATTSSGKNSHNKNRCGIFKTFHQGLNENTVDDRSVFALMKLIDNTLAFSIVGLSGESIG
jgi:hypothetical protein